MAAAMFDADLDDRPVELDLGPAKAVAVGLITAALAWDVWLLRKGYGTLSDLARTPTGAAVRRYFDGHCAETLAFDLLSLGGRVVTSFPRRLP